MANPFIPTPFAFDGQRTEISQSRTDGVVDFEHGYGEDYSRLLGVDPAAKAVERDGQNWLFNVITENIIEWQAGAFPLFLSQRQYGRGAYVRYTTGNASAMRVFRCLAIPPVGTLPTNTAYWEEVLTSQQISDLVPMPYRGIVGAVTDFNSFVTNGTWVFDSAAIVTGSANSPSNSGVGMLETRLTGAGSESLIQRYTSQNGSSVIRGRTSGGTWTPWVTGTYPVPISQGGTGATTAANARTNLGLGSAAVQNIGTSGANVPLLNAGNTWAGTQTFAGSGGVRAQGFGGAANYGRFYGGTGAAFLEYDGTKWAVSNPVSTTYTIIDGGGTTWTSGNFNPNLKFNVSGGDITGNVRAASYGTWSFNSGNTSGRIQFNYYGIEDYFTISSNFNRTSPGAGSTDRTTHGTAEIWVHGSNNAPGEIRLRAGNINQTPTDKVVIDPSLVTFTVPTNYGSSPKLKDETPHEEMPYGLKEILSLNVFRGSYNEDYDPAKRPRLFTDTDSVKAVIPEAVFEGAIEYRGGRVDGLDDSQLVIALIQAVKDLNAKIEDLRNKSEPT